VLVGEALIAVVSILIIMIDLVILQMLH